MLSNTQTLLDKLEESKRLYGQKEISVLPKVLAQLGQREIDGPELLLRFHEALLFFRAYPPNATILHKTDQLLDSFSSRIKILQKQGADLSSLEPPEVSGIAALSVIDTFSYHVVRWLQQHYPSQTSFHWEWFEDENRLAATWPRFMPLLEEDASVEANVPYQEWLRSAKGRNRTELQWLLARFDSLPHSTQEKAELFDSLNLYVLWTPPLHATRTGMKLKRRKIYYHRKPLITRREVSLKDEIKNGEPPVIRNLSEKAGSAILDLAREASTVRYRELYGFTHGDPKRVILASVERGVEMYVIGLPAARRLPIRAYHAAFIMKNGVPIAYFEGLSLFERMESGFNLYYSFREGETAWLYAKTLAVFHSLLGVTAFSIDPYQIGYQNEEGIESGAYWFYRKLGFRSTRKDLQEVSTKEEQRIKAKASYRTPAKVLRKLAEGPMIFEIHDKSVGDWDSFQVRNLGLKIQRRMAAQFNGEADRIRTVVVDEVSEMLGLHNLRLSKAEQNALRTLALVFNLIPDLKHWPEKDKQALVRVLRARAGNDEINYLRQLQRHGRLRNSLIKLGSSS